MDRTQDEAPTVLYVGDDDVTDLDEALATGGEPFRLRRVESIDAALDALDDVDCLVTGREHPDGDAFSLLDAVRARIPEFPVVLYTGEGDEALAARAIQRGMDGYVRHADGPETLFETVSGCVGWYSSTRASVAEVDEFAVLHATTVILARDEPLADRLDALANALVDAFGLPERTAVRVSVGDVTAETPGIDASSIVHGTTVVAADGTTVELEVGRIGSVTASASDAQKALSDAVVGTVRAQVDPPDGGDTGPSTNEILRSFLDSTSVALSIKDADGTYELVNDTFEQVFDVEETTAIGATDWDLFPAPVAQRLRDNDRHVLDVGHAVEFEETVDVDGSARPFLTVRAPLLDDDGGQRGVLTIATDLTDHPGRIVDREQILDRMTDAFLAVDDDWRFTFVNPRATEVLGRTEEELLGTELWTAFPEALGTVFEEQYRYALAECETVEFEAHFDPMDTTFEITAYPSENGLSIFARDVTDRRRTETELEASVETLHRMYTVVSNPDLAFEAKLDRILALGTDRLDLPYGFLTRIDEQQQRIAAAAGDHDLLQPGESCPIEESYCRKTIETDGILAVNDAPGQGWSDDPAYEVFELGAYLGGKVVVDGELYGTLCFASSEVRNRSFSDSERTFVELASRWVSYELERRKYRNRLERQNDRLEKFASSVSHDLRNPLTVASGYLDELRHRYPDEEAIEEIDVSLDRAFTIIDDVLAFARLGDEVVDQDLVALEQVVVDAWERCDLPDATLQFDDLGEIECDPDRLQQLFENLFRNAVDHGGPDVTVTVGRSDEGFYVTDDGPGFGAVDRDRLFEFGYTDAEDGTGFGLAIVDEIASAHGWTVDAADSDEGARFEISVVDDVAELDAAPQ